MSQLHLMVAITDRSVTRKITDLYAHYGVDVTFSTVGAGTAVSAILDSFGLEKTEKTIIFSLVTRETWQQIKKGLQQQLKIDIPGTGVAFIIPLSSIGGKKPLYFFTENQHFEKGEESELKETKYELLVVVANQGYTEMIMDAAREAKATGGTVIHAKGTGIEKAEKFLGVSLASEKEMIFMVVKKENKNPIMNAIMEKAGLTTKAKAIVFSLPVTDTAGMRLTEEAAEEEEEQK